MEIKQRDLVHQAEQHRHRFFDSVWSVGRRDRPERLRRRREGRYCRVATVDRCLVDPTEHELLYPQRNVGHVRRYSGACFLQKVKMYSQHYQPRILAIDVDGRRKNMKTPDGIANISRGWKIAKQYFGFVVLLFLLLSARMDVAGQSGQSTENKADQTLRGSGRVNPTTLGMEFDLPLGNYSGRGINMPISLSYTSKVWRLDLAGDVSSSNPSGCNSYYRAKYSENSASGWSSSLAVPYIEYVGLDNPFTLSGFPHTPETTWCHSDGSHLQYVDRILAHLPGGETHELQNVGDFGWYKTYYAIDSSNLKYTETSSSFRLQITDGSYYDFAKASPIQMNGATVRKATEYTDRNGNSITYNNATGVVTDTLGREFTAPLGLTAPTSPTTSTAPIEYALPGMGNPYKFHWKYLKGVSEEESGLLDYDQDLKYPGPRYGISTSPWWAAHTNVLFGGMVLSGANVFNPIVLTEIELPTGQKYKFRYDLYGRIIQLLYPTGGEESFTYSPVAPLSFADEYNVTDQTNYGVTQRKVYETAGQSANYEWNYAVTENEGGGYKVSMTNPDGTVVQRFIHRADQACVGCEEGAFGYDNALAGMVYEERHFSSSGSLVSRKLTHWTKTITDSYAEFHVDWHPRIDHEENYTYDSTGNGVYSTIKYEYEGNLDLPDTPVLVNKVTQWGYQTTSGGGSITPSATPSASPTPVPTPVPSASPARTMESTFLISDTNYSSVKSNYTDQNLVGLVTVTKVKDASNTVVSQNENVYDESGRSPGYRGNVTTVKTWDSAKGAVTSSSNFIFGRAKFDSYGNAYESTDANGNTTTTTFDSTYHAFPIQITSPVPGSGTYGSNSAFVTTATFDPVTGLPLTTTDANDLKTVIEYDEDTSRPTSAKKYINGTSTQVGGTSETIYHDEEGNYWVKSRSQIDADHWAESKTYFDGLGRAYKTEEVTSKGNVFVSKEFDADGRVLRVSNPYRLIDDPCYVSSAIVCWTTNTYDTSSRVIEVGFPDGSEIQTQYGVSTSGTIGLTKQITDQAGKKRKGIMDADGNMIRVIEDPTSQNLSTDYVFDTLGNLRKTTQGSQNRYFYNSSLGRLLYAKQVEQDTNSNFTATDPVTGNSAWSAKYEYDNNGNIVKTTDAKNLYVEGTYDNLNRITYRNYSDSATPDVTFYYDGTGLGSVPDHSKGKITRVTSSVSETKYTGFDIFGRLLSHSQMTDGTTYTTGYAYNLSGALIEETYPSGRVVKNTLDEDGALSQVQSKKNSTSGYWAYASSFSYDTSGAVKKMQLGNGRWENFNYNDRGQLTQIGLGTSDSTQDLLKLEYRYGVWNGSTLDETKNNGSLAEQKITVPTVGGSSGFTATQTYTYDDLNRIYSAEEKVSSTTTWKQTFDYDRYGNRRFNTSGTNTTTLGSCTTAICNPTISTSTNRITSSGYSYDANGSVIANAAGERFGYDAENHQREFFVSWNGGDTPDATYDYDGEGRRVKKVSSTETTIFVYDGGGQMIAEYSTALATTQQVSYMTADHLGSPRVVTNENGAVVNREDYSAFGERSSSSQRTSSLGYPGADEVRKGYTGYEKDDESGLDFAQARYYSSVHGRYTSIDPMTASATTKDPQTFNRYSYVLNSPYKFVDPLGLIASNPSRCRGSDCPPPDGSAAMGNYGERYGEAPLEVVETNAGVADGQPVTHEGLHAEQQPIPSGHAIEETETNGDEPIIVANGEPGTVRNVGQNFYRSAMTAASDLKASGIEALYFGTVASVEGFQGLLDMAAKYGATAIAIYTHGDPNRIFLGDGRPNDHNTVTTGSVGTLVNRATSLVSIFIYGCNAGFSDNGIAQKLANQLGVTVHASTSGMQFSNRPDRLSGKKVHSSTGPTYMVPEGNGRMKPFFSQLR
ncbi:MAG: hypothetical protein DMF63_07355 [Acidobacteria bacterium]|nr:MAG: hypothetical protein DMF63_07355 [Acidobacteriota bacterium]